MTAATHALILAGRVWQTFDHDPQLGDGHDVRDVSAVPGVTEGWAAHSDGTLTPPPPVPPPTVFELRAYADVRLSALSTSEITVNLGTKTKPIPISAATDATGRTAVLGMLAAYREGLKAEGDTTRWYQSSGAVDLTQAQLVTIGGAVLAHGDGVFAGWQRAVQAISDGTAKSFVDVDALFVEPA